MGDDDDYLSSGVSSDEDNSIPFSAVKKKQAEIKEETKVGIQTEQAITEKLETNQGRHWLNSFPIFLFAKFCI